MFKTQAIDNSLSKKEQYKTLFDSIKSITQGEPDLIANLSNICALFKHEMNWFWVGFYLVKKEELVLGPFQGTLACTRIQKGKGVCGTAWKELKTQVVPNVDLFEGHIACSSATKSEIVIPIINSNGECLGVIDVDSEYLNTFDVKDQEGLEPIVNYIASLF